MFKALILSLLHEVIPRAELNKAMCIVIGIILNTHWNLSDTKNAQFIRTYLNALETNFVSECKIN